MKRHVSALSAALFIITLGVPAWAATYGSVNLMVPLTIDGIPNVPTPVLNCIMRSSAVGALPSAYPIPNGITSVLLAQAPSSPASSSYRYHGPAVAVVIVNYGNPNYLGTGAVIRCTFDPVWGFQMTPASNYYVDFTLPSATGTGPTFTTSPIAIQGVPKPTPTPTLSSERLIIIGVAKQEIRGNAYPVQPPTRGQALTRYGKIALSAPPTKKTYYDFMLWLPLTVDSLPKQSQEPGVQCLIFSSPVAFPKDNYSSTAAVPLSQGSNGYFYHGSPVAVHMVSNGEIVTGTVLRCSFFTFPMTRFAPGSKDRVDFILP